MWKQQAEEEKQQPETGGSCSSFWCYIEEFVQRPDVRQQRAGGLLHKESLFLKLFFCLSFIPFYYYFFIFYVYCVCCVFKFRSVHWHVYTNLHMRAK